jgi:hypothetical protein
MPARISVKEEGTGTVQFAENENKGHQEGQIGQRRKKVRDSGQFFRRWACLRCGSQLWLCRRRGKKHQLIRPAATGIAARSLGMISRLPLIKRMLRTRSATSCELPPQGVTRRTCVRQRITLGPNSEFSGSCRSNTSFLSMLGNGTPSTQRINMPVRLTFSVKARIGSAFTFPAPT